jgi:2-haloalkanoic acid dehalogenase type II
VNLADYDALSFDCYGTLIDWEAGLLAALRDVLAPRGIDRPDDELLEAYAAIEAPAEAGPYLTYREILAAGLLGVARGLGVEPDRAEVATFADSVGDWPAFPDSSDALARLHERFRLGVITNCDDDLFARSAARLGIDFDWVVTAQQVGSYKPNVHNFEALRERLHASGIASARILHVAQSLYHDHAPAQRLGIHSVWIDRRHDRAGSGATPPSDAHPDATFPSMAAFAAAAVPAG